MQGSIHVVRDMMRPRAGSRNVGVCRSQACKTFLYLPEGVVGIRARRNAMCMQQFGETYVISLFLSCFCLSLTLSVSLSLFL